MSKEPAVKEGKVAAAAMSKEPAAMEGKVAQECSKHKSKRCVT